MILEARPADHSHGRRFVPTRLPWTRGTGTKTDIGRARLTDTDTEHTVDREPQKQPNDITERGDHFQGRNRIVQSALHRSV